MFKKIFVALSCALVVACNHITDKMIEIGEPTYQTAGKLPIRLPIQFDKQDAQYTTEFDIPKDGMYAIYLLFHELPEDKDAKNTELNSQLRAILFKTQGDEPETPILPQEKIHFTVEVIDTQTGKQVLFQDSKMRDEIRSAFTSGFFRIHFAHINNNWSTFPFKKGHYRLILKNKNAVSAYTPYPISLQVSKYIPRK